MKEVFPDGHAEAYLVAGVCGLTVIQARDYRCAKHLKHGDTVANWLSIICLIISEPNSITEQPSFAREGMEFAPPPTEGGE